MKFLNFVITIPAIFAVVGAFSSPATAQEIMKHPRVAELEDVLQDSAAEYVKARFPAVPFMVTVRVDPLRRESLSAAGLNGEDLPYISTDDEEIRDEWDNPQFPLKALINRVRKIQVTVSVPAQIKETEVAELRDGIFNILHLTPARDEISIARRNWTMHEVPWLPLAGAATLVLVLLGGLLAINRTSANRIARALGELKMQNAAAAAAPAPRAAFDEPQKTAGGAEVTFNDPFKIKELAARHVEFLTVQPAFPSQDDIYVLEALGRQSPARLGAVLAEFPAEMQKKLFAFSSDPSWIEGLHTPGLLDFAALEGFQALIRIPREEAETHWSATVLAVWRLGEHRQSFIKGMPKEEAFALLAAMPKSTAVAEARQAFPGSWGEILNPDFAPQIPSARRCQEIQKAAHQVLPLRDFSVVHRYREERDLLEYLNTVGPSEENDIYGAARPDSLIHSLRPPFFPVFQLPAETLARFVPEIDVPQWSLALFNVAKPERAKIDQHLSDKQRFLLIENLKSYDLVGPDKKKIGEARENIGRFLRQWNAAQARPEMVAATEAEESPDARAA